MTESTVPRRQRLRALATSPASGALVAQVFQAATSFALQVVAAHLMGARGLGVVALCLGVVVLTTAVTSGFVGDALTVLDRRSARIRGGLQAWTLVLVLVGPTLAALAMYATGTLGAGGSLVFLGAAALFQLEEVARRILMATLRFWRLLVVDGTALVVSLGTIAVLAVRGTVVPASFLGAVAVGQLAGLAVAVALAPAGERRLVRLRGGAVREVASFGAWRGAQVAVNPGLFTVFRVLVVAAAGSATLGQLESARIYVAPAVLAIQGFGSYLLSSYARDRSLALDVLVARARRSSVALVGGALSVGVVLAGAVPLVGPWVTGGSFALPVVAVLGWSVYAACTASAQPFVSLAAARGRQRAVLAVRAGDAAVSAAAVVLLLALGGDPVYAPFALALGPLVGGAVTRAVVLAPMLRVQPGRPTSAPVSSTRSPVELGEAVHHAR